MNEDTFLPSGPLTTNEQLAKIRGGFNTLDPLSAILLLLLFPAFLVVLLVSELWPHSPVAKFVSFTSHHALIGYALAFLVVYLGSLLPFDRKRRQWVSYYAAIRKYDKAVKLLSAYEKRRQPNLLMQCSSLTSAFKPYLGEVPEVAAFLATLKNVTERDFPSIVNDPRVNTRA